MGSCQSTEATVSTPATKSNATAPPKAKEKVVAASTTSVTASTAGNSSSNDASPSAQSGSAAKNNGLPPVHTGERKKLAYTSDTTSPTTGTDRNYTPGYSSGATTPLAGSISSDSGSENGETHPRRKSSAGSVKKPILIHSTSAIGLDSMIESRKEAGDLKSNVVHIEVPFGKPIEEVYEGVHTGPVLGSGISGLVRLVTHKATGLKYAVKCLDLGLVESEEGLQQLREEIFIMCQLDHPNIVRLEEVYESHSEIYLVQELCLGGELFDRLDEQPDYHYTEAQCARLVKQMLNSVRYLHSKGIIHRDLKLENFLFSSTNPDSELKMIDFGLSKHFKFGEVHHEAVGTPYTVAPEVIRGSYDERCDLWAIGVISFLLLSGDPPFGGCGGPEPLMTVRTNILRGDFGFEPEEIWSLVSPLAREFISSLLVVDPQKRPTAKETQKHSWLREWSHRCKTEGDTILNPNVVKALVSFKEFSDMRKLLCEVLSFTLLPDQIKDLRREFEKMDTDGSGEISLGALKQVLIENAGAGSLGALTEDEVEDIFNAMRVRKSEQRIHWHEFIAAGLSQCQVDDRNLRLAFDRLDSDHKGYISFENVMDLMGNDALQSEDAMRRMWGDSMEACQCHHARITYEDFLLLMKGQTKEGGEHLPELGGFHLPSMPGEKLDVLHEGKSDEGHLTSEDERSTGDLLLSNNVSVDGAIADMWVSGESLGAAATGSFESPARRHPSSAPVTPLSHRHLVQMDDEFDTPLSMDEDDDADLALSRCADEAVKRSMMGVEMPPLSGDFDRAYAPSPVAVPQTQSNAGAAGFTTPRSARPAVAPVPEGKGITIPLLPGQLTGSPVTPKPIHSRRRSRSFEEQSNDVPEQDLDEAQFGTDARRAVILPEHMYTDNKVASVIKDESMTPLVVNRTLYRAHRQMRLAVLEASKRFEEQQARRAHDILMAQREAEGKSKGGDKMIGAGLVLRHGHTRQVSSEAIRTFLMQDKKAQQTAVEKANVRGGRGRRNRKKTISDMSLMMSLPDAQAESPDKKTSLRDVTNGEKPQDELPDVKKSGSEQDLDIDSIVQATVPGVFRKTKDPFSLGGRYGAADQYGEDFADQYGEDFANLAPPGTKSGSLSLGSQPPSRKFGSTEGLFAPQDKGEQP